MKDRIYDFLVPIVGWALIITFVTIGAGMGLFFFYTFATFLFLS